jgi:hypothetical protein
MPVIDLWGELLFNRSLAVQLGSEYPSLGSGRFEQKGAEGSIDTVSYSLTRIVGGSQGFEGYT